MYVQGYFSPVRTRSRQKSAFEADNQWRHTGESGTLRLTARPKPRKGQSMADILKEPSWLTIGRELQAIAQTGLAYTKDPFDVERYQRIRILAAQILGMGSNTDVPIVIDLFRQDVGYATPKVDVRGAVFENDRVMLVREVSDNLWSLPGGWADVNQSAAECVVREIGEESGLECRAVKLAAVWDRRLHKHVPPHPHHVYKLYFICHIIGGSLRSGLETSNVAFFGQSDLPELSLTRVTRPQILRMFEHARHPELPTDFDHRGVGPSEIFESLGAHSPNVGSKTPDPSTR
jgi:ADP-ribose pyrophosphatase YjhB (NUDIX family)